MLAPGCIALTSSKSRLLECAALGSVREYWWTGVQRPWPHSAQIPSNYQILQGWGWHPVWPFTRGVVDRRIAPGRTRRWIR
jgi:hypothetical protein